MRSRPKALTYLTAPVNNPLLSALRPEHHREAGRPLLQGFSLANPAQETWRSVFFGGRGLGDWVKMQNVDECECFFFFGGGSFEMSTYQLEFQVWMRCVLVGESDRAAVMLAPCKTVP